MDKVKLAGSAAIGTFPSDEQVSPMPNAFIYTPISGGWVTLQPGTNNRGVTGLTGNGARRQYYRVRRGRIKTNEATDRLIINTNVYYC
jgi:hypothetical protein